MTPLTEETLTNRLWRMMCRLQPMMDMSRHKPDEIDLARIPVHIVSLGDPHHIWPVWTAIGEMFQKTATADPAFELTDAERLWVMITKLHQLMVSGVADAGAEQGDTLQGQILYAAMTIGVEAAFLFGEETEEVLQLRKAKRGRGEHARRLNAERVDWHERAKERAAQLIAQFPRRASERIGELVYETPEVGAPSYGQTVAMIRQWRKEGKLPARAKAG